jgi:hypothetical protein
MGVADSTGSAASGMPGCYATVERAREGARGYHGGVRDTLPEHATLLWTSPQGHLLLEAARSTRGIDALHRPLALEARVPGGTATREALRLALLQDDLRVRGAAKTPHAERLLFTREALEQGTAWPVAVDRARRLDLARGATLVDLGAGVGLDALAAAEQGLQVIACERDPARARLLAFNVRALGLDAQVEVRVIDAVAEPPPGDAAFLDPDRRAHGARTRRAAEFEPPLGAWETLLARYPRAVVKLSPSDAATAADRPTEVVSLDGEARERRVLWRGFDDAPSRCARVLPQGATLAGAGAAWPAPRAPEVGDWLLDPDVAVTLAGLVGELCAAHSLAPIHERIAYLVGATPDPRAPGTWLHVDALLPPDARVLDRWLAEHGVGRLELRSRGVADDASVWRKRLHPRGPAAATLAFTRGPDDRWLVVAARRSG